MVARTTGAIAFAALFVVGCNPTGAETPFRPAACDPSGEASPTDFRHGTATIRITTGALESAALDQIANTTFYARFDPSCPSTAQAEWTDSSDEWLLTVLANASPNDAWSGQQATLWIERYPGEPPLYADGSPCSISLSDMSPSGLAGRAECHGLRWLNDYDAQTDPQGAAPLPDHPPFDASLTFEARP